MGRNEDDRAVVNSQLLLNGISGLKVADLGVMPIIARYVLLLPMENLGTERLMSEYSCHTQTTAYQVGTDRC